jgi:hypothetical protein
MEVFFDVRLKHLADPGILQKTIAGDLNGDKVHNSVDEIFKRIGLT